MAKVASRRRLRKQIFKVKAVPMLAFTLLHIDFQRIARQGEANAQILYKRNISRNRFEQFLRR